MSQRDGAPARQGLLTGRGKARLRKAVSGSMGGLAGWIARFICKTLRVETADERHYFDTPGGKILCLWHGRPLPLTARMMGIDLTVLISLSRDGELINEVLSSMGYDALRGSTGPSGARALASAIKILRAGRTLAVTPDGPRGPSGVVQPGALAMARKSGAAIIPTGSSAQRRIVLKSWDRFMLPLPFSRALVLFGEPIRVPANADDEAVEALRLRLQAEMRRLQDEADRRLGVPTFGEIAAERPV